MHIVDHCFVVLIINNGCTVCEFICYLQYKREQKPSLMQNYIIKSLKKSLCFILQKFVKAPNKTKEPYSIKKNLSFRDYLLFTI